MISNRPEADPRFFRGGGGGGDGRYLGVAESMGRAHKMFQLAFGGKNCLALRRLTATAKRKKIIHRLSAIIMAFYHKY